MARLSISYLLILATVLTPIYSTLAEEAEPGACSIMTVFSDTGEITWSTDAAAAELISIAKDTNLSPEEAHSACHGEDAVKQAVLRFGTCVMKDIVAGLKDLHIRLS